MQPIGIGLIGYGGIGRLHAVCYRMLPLIYPELPPVQLSAVFVQSDRSLARARQELGPAVLVTNDLDQFLAHPTMTLVDCCAPTGDHAALGHAILQAGKGFYCEKPLTADPEASATLVSLAHQLQLPAGVHYHFRAIPALQEAKRRLDQGLLGTMIGFHARYYRASNLRTDRPITWRFAGPGSGVLVDLGAHVIDLVQYLFAPITAVSARLRTIIPERPDQHGQLITMTADEDARLEVELANQAYGTIVVSKLVPGAADDLRIEAYGTTGSLIFDSREPNALWIADGAQAQTGGLLQLQLNRSGPTPSLPGPETPTSTLQWHLATLAGFLLAVARGTAVPVPLEAGQSVDAVIALALRQSASLPPPTAQNK